MGQHGQQRSVFWWSSPCRVIITLCYQSRCCLLQAWTQTPHSSSSQLWKLHGWMDGMLSSEKLYLGWMWSVLLRTSKQTALTIPWRALSLLSQGSLILILLMMLIQKMLPNNPSKLRFLILSGSWKSRRICVVLVIFSDMLSYWCFSFDDEDVVDFLRILCPFEMSQTGIWFPVSLSILILIRPFAMLIFRGCLSSTNVQKSMECLFVMKYLWLLCWLHALLTLRKNVRDPPMLFISESHIAYNLPNYTVTLALCHRLN